MHAKAKRSLKLLMRVLLRFRSPKLDLASSEPFILVHPSGLVDSRDIFLVSA
jgi:hypothetical protein